MVARKPRVGIFGGSGLTGGELLRLLLRHPSFEIRFVHSRHHEGESIGSVHRHLQNLTNLAFVGGSPASIANNTDIVFLALGHGESAMLVSDLSEYDGRIVDLTGDHRLNVPPFQYGLVELHRDTISRSWRVANPGCFATTAILGTAPIISQFPIDGPIFISAVTGSSGSGASPGPQTHHPFRDENLFAYKLFRHQHEPEVAQELARLASPAPAVILTTHSGPFVRGIHATIHMRLKTPVQVEEIRARLKKFYEPSPFIRILNEPPHLKAVVGSNFCDLFVDSRGKEVIVLSALDNLIKGAAGQAIQNANLMLSLSETEGLWAPPLYP